MESPRSLNWRPFGGTGCVRAESIRHAPPRGRHHQSCFWLPLPCGRAALLALVALGLHAQSPGSIMMSGLPQGGIAVIDAQQNVYIAGGGGCAGGFLGPIVCTPMNITKVNAAGRMVFKFVDNQNGIGPRGGLAVDSAGEAYVVCTPFVGGGGFVAKLSADGSKFLYTTQLPASLLWPEAIGLDAQGNAYIAGMSADFHPLVTRMSADGSTFSYTVKLAGSGASSANPDFASAIAVDGAGDAVVTGLTNSPDFPVSAGVLQSALAGPTNAFVTKLDPSGNILFSTFLGGAGGAYGQAILLDSAGNIYTAGVAGTRFPTTSGTYQPVAVIPLWSGGTVGYAAKLKADGSAISWATYAPSNGAIPTFTQREPIELALNSGGEVYLAAGTGPGFVASASAPQPCYGGASDVVLLHLNAQGGLADSTYLGAHESSPFGLSLPGDGSVLLAALTVNIAAVSSGYVPVLAQITFGQPGWVAPACLSPDILNAASFLGGISPGEFVSFTGFGIGPEIGVVYQPGRLGQAPTSLGGVNVYFNGIPAPLLYVQSRQVNAQVPFEVSTSTASVTSVAVTLSYNNQAFGPYMVSSNWLGSPGIFRLEPGVSTQAAALNQDETVNGPANPAAPGSLVTIFGTGYGPLVPSCATGGLNPPGAVPLYWAGTPIGYPVTYEGSAPTLLCGIAQFNFQVPLTAPSGPLLLTPYINPGYGSTIFVR